MRLTRRGSNVAGAVSPHFSIAGEPWSSSILAVQNYSSRNLGQEWT
jgi:hypothetical protein